MALLRFTSSPYVYICTRMRLRKSKLLPREEYMRMLNMSLPEITRAIEETAYKQEIDELGTTFSGIDLIETALTWNLAKDYQKIQMITPGWLKQFTQAYLRRWDIQNILSILRGRMLGEKTEKIKEVIVPAGSLDRGMIDRLLAEDSSERIIELLKGHRMYPVLEREYPAAQQSGSFARMEDELYKQFYAELIAETESGIKGGDRFLEFVKLDIDIRNIKTLFRFRKSSMVQDTGLEQERRVDEKAGEMFIAGGALSADDFIDLNMTVDQKEFIDKLMKKIHNKPLDSFLNELKGRKEIHDIDVRLTRVQLEQMERLSKLTPFSIHPILIYLEKKKYEVYNLRAITRGKQSKLPKEKISEYLVI